MLFFRQIDWLVCSYRYTPPTTPREAVHNASANFETRIGLEKNHLINAYLNGPRTLSNNRLSYLILSTPARDNDNEDKDKDVDASEPSSPATPALSTSSSILSLETPSPSDSFSSRGEDDDVMREYDVMLCATHFLGDGMALHATMNDLFTLLASPSPSNEGRVLSDDDLYDLLDEEWSKRWDQDQTWVEVDGGFGLGMKCLVAEKTPIPPAIESMLPLPKTKFQALAQKVDFKTSQNRLIVRPIISLFSQRIYQLSLNRAVIHSPVHNPPRDTPSSPQPHSTQSLPKPSSINAKYAVLPFLMPYSPYATLHGSEHAPREGWIWTLKRKSFP